MPRKKTAVRRLPAEPHLPVRPGRAGKRASLKRALDAMYRTFDQRYMRSDPLEYVRRFDGRMDREIAAFLAASLAYGNVKQIRRSVENALWRMKPSPSKFVLETPARKMLKAFAGFKHRFSTGRDMACMLHFLREAFRRHGSLEDACAAHYRRTDVNVGPALTGFVEETLTYDYSPFYPGKTLPKDAGVRRFFPSPRNGSACKRLNLFLRWMVRSDKLDLGLWKKIPASKLVIPLDTHVARMARNIGLTRRKSANWKTALEITEALKRFDPDDPIRYDFSLARPGIIGLCTKRWCRACTVMKFCKEAGAF
jgi:uncharacterized protein (TIGR02757 family)